MRDLDASLLIIIYFYLNLALIQVKKKIASLPPRQACPDGILGRSRNTVGRDRDRRRGAAHGGWVCQGSTHQIRSVKPLCRCMDEEELVRTDRMHSRYRSCSC